MACLTCNAQWSTTWYDKSPWLWKDKTRTKLLDLNDNSKYPIDLVKRLDIEWLFEASHTCTEFDVGRCYQQTETIHCWQCMERQWGFIENNMRDPGTK